MSHWRASLRCSSCLFDFVARGLKQHVRIGIEGPTCSMGAYADPFLILKRCRFERRIGLVSRRITYGCASRPTGEVAAGSALIHQLQSRR